MNVRMNDQLFARCTPADRRLAAKAAKALDLNLADFIRAAVGEKAMRVVSTEAAHPGAYRVKENVR